MFAFLAKFGPKASQKRLSFGFLIFFGGPLWFQILPKKQFSDRSMHAYIRGDAYIWEGAYILIFLLIGQNGLIFGRALVFGWALTIGTLRYLL